MGGHWEQPGALPPQAARASGRRTVVQQRSVNRPVFMDVVPRKGGLDFPRGSDGPTFCCVLGGGDVGGGGGVRGRGGLASPRGSDVPTFCCVRGGVDGGGGGVVTGFDAKRCSNLIFAGLFVLALVLFSRILLPFLMPVLLGGFLVVLFQPLQQRLLRARFKLPPSVCAGVSTLAVFLLILVPIVVVGW